MGKIIKFANFRSSEGLTNQLGKNCLIPVEFGVGENELERCIELIAKYGTGAIHVRPVDDANREIIYLIRVSDAITLNKHLLDLDNLTDEQVSRRIDLIQMLENVNTTLLESIWSSYRSGAGHS